MKREIVAATLLAWVVLLGACAPGAALPIPTQPVATATLAPARPTVLQVVPGESEARYRIREQLANLPLPNEVVGVTRSVAGTVTITGRGVDQEQSKITIDVTQLKTDRNNRDRFVQRETLNTDQYPTVTFVPTEIRGIAGELPTSGEGEVEMVGDLTVRDVTRPVTWRGSVKYGENDLMLNASLTTSFAELSMGKPSAAVVLSVEDTFVLEADLKFSVGQGDAPAS